MISVRYDERSTIVISGNMERTRECTLNAVHMPIFNYCSREEAKDSSLDGWTRYSFNHIRKIFVDVCDVIMYDTF